MALNDAKPSKTPSELVEILINREMVIDDKLRAERKLSQVGYYRLSGFWYPCRKFSLDDNGKIKMAHKKPLRNDEFSPNTNFNEVFKIYTFDKKLRLLLIDAIERIEINLKTVLANELGNVDPLAYQKSKYINPIQRKDFYKNNQVKNTWLEWSNKQRSELSRSQEDSIVWHKKSNREMPIWVVVESWSFGTISKYYELLNKSHQTAIAKRLGVSNTKLLIGWLQEINILRNRCAHHSRIWNQASKNTIRFPTEAKELDTIYFNQFDLTDEHRNRKIFVLILIIWFLVKRIGPNSTWINSFINEINSLPKLPFDCYVSMGITKNNINILKKEVG